MNKKKRHEEAMRSLHPVFAMKVKNVLFDLQAKGWQPMLVWGTRSREQQEEIRKKGYGAKHSLHVAATEILISSPERMAIESIRGCAADIVDKRWWWKGPCADKHHNFWQDLGATAKKYGLEWGGDWKKGPHKEDVAHIQMKIIEDRRSFTATV